MTSSDTWEAWQAAECEWKAAHPIAVRGKGWRQAMLAEISGQLGGAQRPEKLGRVKEDNPVAECSFCRVKLDDKGHACENGCEVLTCPACGADFHEGWCG